ncbi:ABC transporter permease [Saccharopolyspora sp. WRP15-2]|uniref:ABC transporter permease n=1 Tax=Saccharopolyspora oryzae TaxID=2997343 RepID=A0ABT4V1T7_9PSEU|nr:ABC transporter permease [Saccharopolyspora oryzae]MDA3627287.1 ABC transporter permease [Saccharopolyspora oryzae]
MSSGSIPVTPALGVAIALLLIAAAAVSGLGRLARFRHVLFAGVRGAVQLAVVSLLIAYLVESTALAALFIVLMFVVAAHTAGRRITDDRSWLWAGLPIAAGVAPAVGLLVVTGAVPLTGLVLIPLVGQLIGGAMVATALAGKRLLDELHQRRGEVEAALSLGMTDRLARLEIARPSAGGALVPALDQTRTVGTVTLPGAFVGMLLGGATPVQAGVVQLYVLVALLAVESVAILVALEIVARGLLTRSGKPLFFRA